MRETTLSRTEDGAINPGALAEGETEENTVVPPNPNIIIFNAAATSIQDSYEAHETIATCLRVPIEAVHDALAEVSSLLTQDGYPSLEQLMEHIRYVESAEQKKLAALVQEEGYHIYILVQWEEARHELLMAFYGLVAAVTQSFPNILCMQICQGCTPTYEVNDEIDMTGFLIQQGMTSTFLPHMAGKSNT